MLRVTLVVEKGSRRPQRVVLRRPRTTIGRQKGCELRVPSADVSRRHCRIDVGDNSLSVEDLNSVNGTYVNDVAVIGRQALLPGDRLRIGPATFVVEFAPLPEDEPSTDLQKRKRPPQTSPERQGKPVTEADQTEADLEVLPEAEFVFDDAEPLDLPENEQLRGILSQLTDSNHPTEPKKK
jgi:pSer/pThr/pTyr-binding forkhead associated (FHA) protein